MIPEVEAYNKKNIDVIRMHLRYGSFRYPYGSGFLIGGKLICVHCGKEYTWKDWGRDKSKALTLARNHLDKHGFYMAFNSYMFTDRDMFYLAFPEAK